MPTTLLTKHWYMPLCFSVRIEIVRVLLLIEIALPVLSCLPLKYQVTTGVGIPQISHENTADPPITCSVSFTGRIIITGGAVSVNVYKL